MGIFESKVLLNLFTLAWVRFQSKTFKYHVENAHFYCADYTYTLVS